MTQSAVNSRSKGKTTKMARKNVIKAFNALVNGDKFNNASVSTSEGIIYSYRMPIAKLTSKNVIEIVNRDESPSVTTSGHINGVRELADENGTLKVERVSKIDC